MATQEILRRAIRLAAAIAVCLSVWGFWTVESQVWGKDLAGHPDEAAHFTSGVMVLDFVRTPDAWAHPVAFASKFYAHYPKVLIGHWPPFFYLVEAGWMEIFGENIASARALVLFALALWLIGIAAWLQLDFDWTLALIAVACLLRLPVVQVSGAYLLSDGLVTALCLGALYCWTRFLESARKGDAIAFALAAAAAILTKGNAWVLIPAAFLAPLFARDLRCYRRPWFWLSLALATSLAAPFYLYAQAMQAAYPVSNVAGAVQVSVLWGRLLMLTSLLATVPAAAWLLICLGLAGAAGNRIRWAVSVSFCAAMLVFLGVTGLSFEGRVMLPMIPLLCAIAVSGLMFAMRLPFPGRIGFVIAFAALSTLPLGGFVPLVRDGYSAVAAQIPSVLLPSVLLVASDSVGEGALVVDRLVLDRQRKDVVIRATKFLSQQDSNGSSYREIYPDDEALLEAIRRVPVLYAVVDDWSDRPHTVRLRRVAEKHFRLIGTNRIGGKRVDLFVDPKAVGRSIENLKFSLGPWHANREIEYQP